MHYELGGFFTMKGILRQKRVPKSKNACSGEPPSLEEWLTPIHCSLLGMGDGGHSASA